MHHFQTRCHLLGALPPYTYPALFLDAAGRLRPPDLLIYQPLEKNPGGANGTNMICANSITSLKGVSDTRENRSRVGKQQVATDRTSRNEESVTTTKNEDRGLKASVLNTDSFCACWCNVSNVLKSAVY